jgi:glutamate---cysteine ligase / carboxylate-amine ligase
MPHLRWDDADDMGMARSPYDIGDPPAWEHAPPLTVDRCLRAFDHDSDFTIGVEEELMLVDPQSLDLAPVIHDVLPVLDGDRRFEHELRAAQIEIVSPVCRTPSQSCTVLGEARRLLVERLAGRWRILASGTHPFSTRHGEITEADRYRQIADEYTWAALRSIVCGLHVHIGVAGATRALAVYNALRSYLPELAALGANSAFAEGLDTHMASVRPKFNEIYPRSGIPPAFPTWEELVGFVEWGRAGGLFPDASHFWWEMRLHPVHGTIEIRVADTQTRIEDATAIVAVMQSLVAMLAERVDADGVLPCHDTYRIRENAWRAHRHGVRGWLVDLDTGRRIETRERLASLLDELEQHAELFGAASSLHDARALLAGNGADRQRYVYEREGMRGLTQWLADETEASALDA